MTQLGEGIDYHVFIDSNVKHSNDTCPWPHKEEPPRSAEPMEPQEADEDSHGPIPANLGKKLGNNMGVSDKPSATGVWLYFRSEEVLYFWPGKSGKMHEVQTYSKSSFRKQYYPLKYAPHHLVPGNESLKGSKILLYMGDRDVIAGYKPPGASKLKKGESIGYDVNAKENGVWLPSPYALSNSNKWPSQGSQGGIKAVLKRKGELAANDLEEFKDAYAAAAMEAAGGRQFHMRHNNYSKEVRKALNAIADKLENLSEKCEFAPAGNGKLKAPLGLKARLNALSSRLSTLLTGTVWRAPFYADNKAIPNYLKYLEQHKGEKMFQGPHGIEPVI